MRPAYVDTANDPEVLKVMLSRPEQQTWKARSLHTVFGPVMRNVFTSSDSPTQYLGKFLTDVAKGDGKPLSENGVSGNGRIIPNVVFRKLVGL